MKDAPKQIVKLADLIKVLRFCAGGNYIFRGENKNYSQVTSGLYREYSRGEKPLTAQSDFSILNVEKRIINGARKHLQDGASDIEVLTELQHFGGKTNLIDFTKNLYIAIFFACDGEIDEDGRLILVGKSTLDNTEINYNKSAEAIKANNILASPTGKSPRAIFQSGAFIHPHKGYLEKGDYYSVVINAELKSELLLYLQKHHDISSKTVYNDIHGFIRNQSIETAANERFFLGYSCSTSDDPKGAVQYYGEAIKLNPQMLVAYTNRGISYTQLHQYEEAIVDYTKAIKLQPRISRNYFLRGMAHKLAGNLDAALVDYNEAIRVGPSHAKYHIGLGEVYLRTQKYDDAISQFNEALRLDPHNQDMREHLGYTYIALTNWEEALTHMRIARDLNIQKKFLDKAEELTPMIATLEKSVAEKTYPKIKATKKATPKAAKAKKPKK